MNGRIKICTLFAILALPVFSAEPGDSGAEFFTKKIEPILAEHCYKCHSAKAEKIKGGLLLDTREGLLKGGDTGAAVNPGDTDNSRIVIAVRHTDPDLRMPPKEKLSDDQIALFEQWVKMGAPDPRTSPGTIYRQVKDLWSAKPLQHVAPPQVDSATGIHHPVDAFLLAAQEKHHLHPVKPADRRSLIRRATFDLLGLPPTPAEVDAFVADPSEDAFAKVVDRLLKSPHFGERWGRHWLDLARYSDSNGPDFTLYPNAWRYRDYVVQAFNRDMPYNEFIREQLAGDLLPSKDLEDRRDKWIATGFLMLGPKNFGEPNREKLLMDVADEQIDVTSRALLGLTVSCARCHDHKFDPIPTRDYYALAGIFRSSQTLSADFRGPRNGSPFSERALGTEAETAAYEEYQTKLTSLEGKRDRARQLARELPGGIDSKQLDGIVIDNLDAEVVGNWKLSNYSTNFVDKNYLHDGNEKREKTSKLVRFRPNVPADGLYEVRFAYTARLNRATNVPVRVQGRGMSRTVYLNETVEPKYDKAFESVGFFQLEKGTNNTVEVLAEGTKGFVVVDAVQFLPQEVQLAAMFAKKRPATDSEESMAMMDGVSASKLMEYDSEIGDLMSKAPPPLPVAMAIRDGEVRNAKLLIRGDIEHPGNEVPRGFLSVVDHIQTGALDTKSSGRLQLANWIAREQNPLTARVMVNRIWQHLFGRGLVGTPDNFGSMGELPTHPELLDYLASEFMTNGWSVKTMIRRLMLTSAYQRSAEYDQLDHTADPDNRYLWRMNRKRLDAESLRDAILAVNGSLDLTIGGAETNAAPAATPGVPLDSSILQNRRRSLYLPVFRGSLNDLFQVFDFPDPNALSGKRYVTTAPTQALFLMNSPFMLQSAESWAERLTTNSASSDSDLIERAYTSAFARPCTAEEAQRAATFLKNYNASLIQIEPDAAIRHKKVWDGFCQALFESAEFRFLN